MDALNDAQRKLARQRYWLLERHPFFATPLLQLRHVADGSIESVASDGTTLWYNPEFVNAANTDELRYQLCQVVMACCLKHHTRRDGRDNERWQIASQLVIRPILYKAGLTLESQPGIETSIERAFGMVRDGDGTQNGARIMDAPKGTGKGKGDGTGKGKGKGDGKSDADAAVASAVGNSADESDDSDAAQGDGGYDDEESKWDRLVAQSKAFERLNGAGGKAGNATGGIESMIDAAKANQLDWRDVLREFLTQPAKLDYSWSTPNRRYIDAGLYLPSADGTARGNFAMAIDTSGSMSNEALRMVWGEVLAICNDTLPESVTVIFADTQVKSVQRFEFDDLPETIQMPGRGGTRFAPVFSEVDEWVEQPDALIFLTDMCADDFPETEPDYPVLWAGIDFVVYPDGAHRDVRHWQGTPPFGERVSLTVNYGD